MKKFKFRRVIRDKWAEFDKKVQIPPRNIAFMRKILNYLTVK